MIDALVSGKLIRDPMMKTSQSGKPYCNFMIGAEENIIVSGVAFGETGDRIGSMTKGQPLAVMGGIKPSSWNDKSTGDTKLGLNITVSTMLNLPVKTNPAPIDDFF